MGNATSTLHHLIQCLACILLIPSGHLRWTSPLRDGQGRGRNAFSVSRVQLLFMTDARYSATVTGTDATTGFVVLEDERQILWWLHIALQRLLSLLYSEELQQRCLACTLEIRYFARHHPYA